MRIAGEEHIMPLTGYEAEEDIEDTNAPTRRAVTRNSDANCLVFGAHRKELYPKHFFCHQCDLWEQEAALLQKRASRSSRRYACRASHNSPLFPTQLKKVYEDASSSNLPPPRSRDRNHEGESDVSSRSCKATSCAVDRYDEDASSCSENLSDESCHTNHTNNGNKNESSVCNITCRLASSGKEKRSGAGSEQDADDEEQKAGTSVIDNLRNQVQTLRHALTVSERRENRYRRQLTRLKGRLQIAGEGGASPASASTSSSKMNTSGCQQQLLIEKAICNIVHASGWKKHNKTLGKSIAKAALTVLDGIAFDAVMSVAKKHLRESVYTPWNIARLMDLHGGSLNLTGIELLRSLETRGKKYSHSTLLPSSSSIQRVFQIVEGIGATRVPFELKWLPEGEAIIFDYRKVFVELVQAYGLDNIARERSIAIGQSVDGADLSRHLSHVTAGYKIRDMSAIDPLTRQPVFAGSHSTAQSRNHCFPCQIHLARESKQIFEHLRPLFQFMEDASKNGVDEYKPLKLSTEIDMSAGWKGLGRGGAAKVHDYPCHCCGVRSKNLHHGAPSFCERWCSVLHAEKAGWICHHRPIVTDEVLDGMQEEAKQLCETLDDQVSSIMDRTKFTYEDPASIAGNENSKRDPHSIWFEPETPIERRDYSKFINDELLIRRMTLTGNLTTRREGLRDQMQSEWRLHTLNAEVKACGRPATALFILMETIPCILHMENRVGLKLLTMLLLEGITRSRDGLLFTEIGSEKGRVKAYIKCTEDIMNTQILGGQHNPSTWLCPYDEREGKLGPVSLENTKTRQVVNNLALLVEVSVGPADCDPTGRKLKWHNCVQEYREAMVICRKKEDLSDLDISNFQEHIDLWIQDWITLHSLDGMTNYIHMLAAGHISEYMFKWRNLYRHSQQGWEAFNSLLKTFFFRRTGRGGGRGVRTKLKPIARWLQRRMLWLFGLDESDMSAFSLPASREAILLAGEEQEEHTEIEDEEEEHLDLLLTQLDNTYFI